MKKTIITEVEVSVNEQYTDQQMNDCLGLCFSVLDRSPIDEDYNDFLENMGIDYKIIGGSAQ